MIKEMFTVNKYDIQKDKELKLKDKIFAIENDISFKIQKIETATRQKVEKIKNSQHTKLDRLTRKLTRIRMEKYNEAKYVYEDSCIADVIKQEQKKMNAQPKPTIANKLKEINNKKENK